MYGYYREKFHVNHFWELKGWVNERLLGATVHSHIHQLHRWISYAQTQGSQMHMYNFFVCMVEKNVRLMYLCYNSVLQVSFVLHFCVEQRTFRFEKAASRQQKIYIMKKAIMLHSCMSYMSLYLMPFLDYSTRWWELKPYAISNILWHALNHLLITT